MKNLGNIRTAFRVVFGNFGRFTVLKDEGLTLEMAPFKLFTVANLRFQLS